MYKLWFCLNFCQIKIKNHLKHNLYHRCLLTDAYFSYGKHQCNIIIREQLLLLLLLSFVMNHFNHKSRVTVSYIYMSFQFISLFQFSKNFPLKILCHSLLQWGIYHSRFTNLQSIPLICMDIHALLLLSAAPPPGGQPPPASDRGRLPGLCSNYVNIYVNLSMYTLIRSQSSDCLSQDPLPNWLTKVSQPRV